MSTPSPNPSVTVATATVVPWSKLPGASVIDVRPPTGGALELPGPRTRPVRSHIELAAAPAGIAGRVVQADGKVLALALRDGDVIPLPAPPVAVVAHSAGVWAMYRDGLVLHDRQGAVQRRVALSGVSLIAGSGDAVWVASSEQAWHVDAASSVHGPFAWHDPLTAFASGGRLCARVRHDARAVACLAGDGTATSVAIAVELAPLEQPIALDGDRLVTVQGVTVRERRASELIGAWTLQAAGIDAAGAGFALSANDGKLVLWRAASARELPAPGPGALSAASVAGEDVLLYSQGWATRHHGASAGPSTQIDEASYRATIFPSAWEMSPQHAIAVRPDGKIVVGASGPTGVALVELRATRAPGS